MRYHRALKHTSFVCLETFRSIFAVTLPLVRSNSWDAQLAVPNDPRYARLEKGSNSGNSAETVLRHPFRVRLSIVFLKNGSWESLHEWQHIWPQEVMDITLGSHGAPDQY
ncbi:hypothetical protein TNCV_4016111 [Trichonephila clavipes]|nr:hypothetical protein TNCV_4016111 [Trichonephila clavipes]